MVLIDVPVCTFTCRLSYHQRIVDIVPPTFSALIPADPIFIYKYADESACKEPSVLMSPAASTDCTHNVVSHLTASLPGYPVSLTVINAIKNRASNEEILTILKEVPNPNQDDDDGAFAPPLFQ